MASGGGALNGVPQLIQQPPAAAVVGGVTCSQCGLLVDSATSLQVHMHYHHESQNRWGPAPPAPTSSSNTVNNQSRSPSGDLIQETNNNLPILKHNIQQITNNKASSPTVSNSGGSTIAAAADSSQTTPTNSSMDPQQFNEGLRSNGGSSAYQSEMNYYMNQQQFEQQQHSHYQQQHYPQMDYQHPMNNNSSSANANGVSTNILMAPQQQQHEYKASVPSTRFHPYSSNASNQNTNTANAIISSSSAATTITSTTSSSSSSSVSPRIVSSTSPSHHQSANLRQPTPSPSPKQCDKCGMVCETVGQLSDHLATVHGGGNGSEMNQTRPRSQDQNNEFNNPYPPHPPMQFNSVKDEPPCDILDLDSQKMVYQNNNDPLLMNKMQADYNHNNNQGPLPSMHSLHPMQAMQRHAMLWHHPQHEYNLGPIQSQIANPNQLPLKQDYSLLSPVLKSDYNIPPPSNSNNHLSSSPSTLKSEFTQHMSADIKAFDQSSLTTSPPDFPTTTTPQDNNPSNGNSFRNFEPSSSSLPTTMGTGKSSSWKSNEARRPKTYNCTACNKWFTSSGHLKRHYNTTLHKNAVKSSGQPDPATMPISAHHHPSRDPNSKHHRNSAQSNAGVNTGQPPPQPPPPDPQRSPEYSPQYTPGFAPSGQQQQQQMNQGFQQYGNTVLPPNEQAGPSVHASQPRGLLIYSNLNNMETDQPLELQPPPQHHPITNSITIIPSISHPNRTSPCTITTTTTTDNSMVLQQDFTSSHSITTTTISPHSMLPLSQPEPIPQAHQLNYPIIIGNCEEETTCLPFEDFEAQSPETRTVAVGTTLYSIRMLGENVGDIVPPFSPGVPDNVFLKQSMHSEHTMTYLHPVQPHLHQQQMQQMPKLAATAPLSPAPGSPSVTSSDTLTHETLLETKPAKHQCIQCDKVFNKACYLTQHNKTFHSGDKPFKCARCGKRFPCGQSHEEHVAKHGGDKPFKCELCPKAFNHKTDLRRHMCLHSGNKPFVCESCGKGFIRKDHLVKHMDVHRRKDQMKKKMDTNTKGKESKRIKLESFSTVDDSSSLIMGL